MVNRFTIIITAIIFNTSVFASDDCNKCHSPVPLSPNYKTLGSTDIAVGILDKGQLADYSGNMGDLANYHLWTENSGHWPRTGLWDRQYAFGLGLIVGINDTNVIETVSQWESEVTDWLPRDFAFGRDYSGDIVSVSDETPFQASSDFYETWPYGYYDVNGDWNSTSDRIWPGFYRVDVGSLTPQEINDHPDAVLLPKRYNEFTSDRDVYCVYNDNHNSRGQVGIEVEQTAHSYGRPYAEDFLFWDMKIHNTSGVNLNSIYVGMYAVFRPDYDYHDYINFVDSDDDGIKDLVYVYDLNNVKNKSWSGTDAPMGIPALRIYDTPNQMGITNFHHFARGVSPKYDEQMWAILTSDISDTNLTDNDFYFHGNDINIDDTDTDSIASYYPRWFDDESGVDLEGDGINFIVSCGPFDLLADSTVAFSLGMIMGDAGTVPDNPDTTDLMSNVLMANDMYRTYFQGSPPPNPPNVIGIPHDRSVMLYWESEPSESSVDAVTQKKDFEGYKVFRSEDQGNTWGDIITDMHGREIGYLPIGIFDLIDSVGGLDPAFPQNLGTDSGLSHTFKDSNLINGVEYWYCVTAYDKGNQHPDSLEQSYIYPLGSSTIEPHTVSIVPGRIATNVQAAIGPTGNLEPIGGSCEGIVRVEIAESDSILNHGYKISFTEDAIYDSSDGEIIYGTGFTLIDTTENDTLFYNNPLSDKSLDNLPIVDGFRLIVKDAEKGIKYAGWTKVLNDTCTFDWRFESIDPSAGNQIVQKDISTIDDWRITVTYNELHSIQWIDIFSGVVQDSMLDFPIKIEITTDSESPRNVTPESYLGEFAIPAPWDYRKDYYSPLGWDLEPGGLGFLEAGPGWYDKHVDIIILESDYIDTVYHESGLMDSIVTDTTYNYLFMFTNNKPDTSIYYNSESNQNDLLIIDAKAPSDGDEFTIITWKNFTPDISYTFGFTPQQKKIIEANPLKDIRVVPDPYVVTNIWETSEFGKKLQFNHLPDQCTIKIYTLVGDHIATVNHDDPNGYAFWDMRTKNDQFIAPGVYIFYAKTPDGGEATGRFLVIK
ncbi:MAG: hypothetical protein HQ509_03895 [Candidatus Marinimicrobia bacterium]|nr:hypothetical protein [Candidatus Neomarinimicrobiota bacterium]